MIWQKDGPGKGVKACVCPGVLKPRELGKGVLSSVEGGALERTGEEAGKRRKDGDCARKSRSILPAIVCEQTRDMKSPPC